MKDFSGDGKITQKDVLMGRGVIPKKKAAMGGGIKAGYKYGGKVKKGYNYGGCVMSGRGGSFKGSN
jgi:hypothetical protein